MIPLMKPQFPKSDTIKKYFDLIKESNIYTNCGNFYNLAVKTVGYHYTGFPIITSNGTVSIELMLKTLLPRGSRVAIPDFTFIATLNAVVNAGMKPVLLDADPKTLSLSISSLKKHRNKFDAFIVVSPFGYYVNTEEYDNLAKTLRKQVMYDFAGGFGLEISKVNPTSFSLHATKNLPVGEGGLVIFNSEEQVNKAKQISNFNLNIDKIPADEYGSNYKIDELHCAILLDQLLTFNKEKSNKIVELIKTYEQRTNCFELLGVNLDKSCPQLPVLKCKNLTEVIEKCTKNGIMVRRYYYPLLSNCKFKSVSTYEKSKECDSYLALPKDITEKELEFIIGVLNG